MPWPSIFTPKNPKHHVTVGGLTNAGARAFEQARTKLKKLSGQSRVSDADVLEYLARGEAETRKVLEK
jgi:hypothetical protein